MRLRIPVFSATAGPAVSDVAVPDVVPDVAVREAAVPKVTASDATASGRPASDTREGRLPITPSIGDLAAALVLGLLMVQSATRPVPFPALHPPMYLGLMSACAVAAAVALRRFAPLAALGIAMLGCMLLYAGGFQRDPSIAVGFVLYTVASVKSWRVSISALAASIAITLLGYGVTPSPYAVAYKIESQRPAVLILLAMSITPLAVQFAGWALGFAVRRQRLYVAAVRAQAEDQVRVQSELAWRAVTEERLRIARELHDVVAHGMSVITVQAGVGRHVIDEQPEQARAALGAIEVAGRESLRELRRLLGVLREDAGDPARAPAPRLADLQELVQRTAKTGTDVDFSVRGEPRVLPGGVELSAYRIVQEALTNVVKHAATDRCRVRLEYASDALGIEITDDGVGAAAVRAAGHGIIGMRERAALLGGRFEAGPLPLRGYRVAASLPLERVDT